MRFFTCILLVAVLGTALLLTSVAADTTAGNGSGYITVINLPVPVFTPVSGTARLRLRSVLPIHPRVSSP